MLGGVEDVIGLYVTGDCNNDTSDHNGYWHSLGQTASGHYFFKHTEQEYYIYFDPYCDGNPGTAARWIMDSDSPSTSAAGDLDNDGTCYYHGRYNTEGTNPVPPSAIWRSWCVDTAWTDSDVTITQVSCLLQKLGLSCFSRPADPPPKPYFWLLFRCPCSPSLDADFQRFSAFSFTPALIPCFFPLMSPKRRFRSVFSRSSCRHQFFAWFMHCYLKQIILVFTRRNGMHGCLCRTCWRIWSRARPLAAWLLAYMLAQHYSRARPHAAWLLRTCWHIG